ncbi:MAG: AI-2E family transporter [Chloroflexota bacterium]
MKTPWDIPFRYIVMIFLAIFALAALWYIRDVFKPLISAGLMAYFLSPAVNFLVLRAHIRRKVAANIVYFVTLIVLIALPFTILPALFDEFQGIMTDLNRTLNQMQTVLVEPQKIGNVNLYLGGLIPAIRENLNADIVPLPEDALRVLEITSRNFLWLLVVLVTAYYLMTDWERLKNWLIRLAPEEEQPDMDQLYHDIRKVWSSYLGGQIKLIIILAILYSIVWTAIGLPGALGLGILAGLMNLIPEVGPAGAAIFATTVALLEGSNFFEMPNFFFAMLTLGIYLLVNTFKTVWLQPRVLGHSVFLHEGLVFVAIITAIVLLGVLGVLIVVPLLATLVVVGRYLRRRLLGMASFVEREALTVSADTLSAERRKNPPRSARKSKKTKHTK